MGGLGGEEIFHRVLVKLCTDFLDMPPILLCRHLGSLNETVEGRCTP